MDLLRHVAAQKDQHIATLTKEKNRIADRLRRVQEEHMEEREKRRRQEEKEKER